MDRIRVVAPNPGLLAAMLKAQRLTGVLRWKVNFTEAVVAAEAGLAGWNYIWLDSSGARAEQDFIDLVAQQILRPDLVGCDLVAIAHELVGFDGDTANYCIAWTGWQELVKSDSGAAQRIADELEAAGSEKTNVVLVCDSSGNFPGISELTQG
ncbi:MAG: hypothetical protein RL741_888 [Actinomycetota bacterium]